MIKGLLIVWLLICLICGIVCVTINLVRINYTKPETKIVYRYIPKTFDEQQRESPYVSDLFKTMFTDQTPWIDSVMNYDRRKQEVVNKYFVSQI
jgi:uncharacterized membrane protein